MTTATILKASGDIEDPAARLFRLLELEDRRIQRIFLTAVKSLKDEIDFDDLALLLAQGRTTEAFANLNQIAEAVANANTVTFVSSGHAAAEFMEGAGLGRIAFDQINIDAVAAMQRNRLRIIREFTNEQRKATQTAIVQGIEGGINPRAAARNFRDSIGLTTRQWGHVATYRQALQRAGDDAAAAQNALGRKLRDARSDRSILRAARDSRPIPPSQIDDMVQRYTDGYIKHRAEVIARTEALRAVHQGNEEAYRQAVSNGVIDQGQIEREWRTSVDGRERATHLGLNGQKRKTGEVWTTFNGAIRYPGDPDAPAAETIQCRCALLTRIKAK